MGHRVKRGYNVETGNEIALKIIENSNAKAVGTLVKEIQAMKELR